MPVCICDMYVVCVRGEHEGGSCVWCVCVCVCVCVHVWCVNVCASLCVHPPSRSGQRRLWGLAALPELRGEVQAETDTDTPGTHMHKLVWSLWMVGVAMT